MGSSIKRTHAIRAQRRQDTRIVMVTASAFEEGRQLALAAGADDFISRPFREVEILAAIQRVFPAIVYRYENPAATPKANADDDCQAKVMKLDSMLAVELVNLIDCRNVADFRQALDKSVRESSPALHDFLHSLAEKFEYEHIVTILAPASGHQG